MGEEAAVICAHANDMDSLLLLARRFPLPVIGPVQRLSLDKEDAVSEL